MISTIISKISRRLYAPVFLMLIIIMPAGTRLWAANQVNFQISGGVDDSLRVGVPATIDIYLENDYVIYGMSLGFKIWSPDGAFWNWTNVGGLGATTGCVTTVPYSRLGDGSVFNMTGFDVIEYDVDGVSPDMIMCGGVANEGGIPTGPLEHMYSMHFEPLACLYPTIRTICIDSAFVPPSGAFVFVNAYGNAVPPTTLWPNGGRCYPIGWVRNLPPHWNPDLPTTMIIEPGSAGSVTLSGADWEGDFISFGNLQLTGGAGEATLDDHGDGTCEVFYASVPEDEGQEITIEVEIVDTYHGYCTVLPHVIDVIVAESSLEIDCGAAYISGATNNLIVKNDISVSEQSPSKALAYSLIEGPGEIDGTTGIYSWMPGPTDIGIFAVTVNITNGLANGQCVFEVDVVDEACCPGDANFTGDVNVGDAVFLINYIFKGGLAPKVMNWADPNADCQVNVGDVVFLIGYVFRGGAAPVLGCYY